MRYTVSTTRKNVPITLCSVLLKLTYWSIIAPWQCQFNLRCLIPNKNMFLRWCLSMTMLGSWNLTAYYSCVWWSPLRCFFLLNKIFFYSESEFTFRQVGCVIHCIVETNPCWNYDNSPCRQFASLLMLFAVVA